MNRTATKTRQIINPPHGQRYKLAKELGISDRTLRSYLRQDYGKWDIAYERQEQVRQFVIKRFGAACISTKRIS